MNLQGRTALSPQTGLVQISLRRSIGKRRTGVGLPDDLKPGLRRTSCKNHVIARAHRARGNP